MRNLPIPPNNADLAIDACGDSVMIVSKNATIPLHLVPAIPGVSMGNPYIKFDDDVIETPLELNTVYRKPFKRRIIVNTPFHDDGLTEFEVLIGDKGRFPMLDRQRSPLFYHFYREAEQHTAATRRLYVGVVNADLWYKPVKRMGLDCQEEGVIIDEGVGIVDDGVGGAIIAQIDDVNFASILGNMEFNFVVPAVGYPVGSVLSIGPFDIIGNGMGGAETLSVPVQNIPLPLGLPPGAAIVDFVFPIINIPYLPIWMGPYPDALVMGVPVGNVPYSAYGAFANASAFTLDVYSHLTPLAPVQWPVARYTSAIPAGLNYPGLNHPIHQRIRRLEWTNLDGFFSNVGISLLGEIDA